MFRDQDPEDERALLPPEWKKPSPDTLTSALSLYLNLYYTNLLTNVNTKTVAELIKRLRALTLRLLPLEVDVKIINEPINRIITPRVMLAYMEAAGDFGDAVGSSPIPGTCDGA